MINNRRLKVMEKRKNASEIDKYRYTRLHEMLLNWKSYNPEMKEESLKEDIDEIEEENLKEDMQEIKRGISDEFLYRKRIMSEFFGDCERYDIIKPLLDEKYIKELDEKKEKCSDLFMSFMKFEYWENIDNIEKYTKVKNDFYLSEGEFSKLLRNSVNIQLRDLFSKFK